MARRKPVAVSLEETMIRFCNTDTEIAEARLCKWPDDDVPIAVIAIPDEITETEFLVALNWVCSQINGACGAKLTTTTTARLARITCDTRFIDGPGGVLAESELPCGNVTRCRQWYGKSEHWTTIWPNFPRNKISLHLVLLHEIMHALGIGHAPRGIVAVIAPIYNPDLRELQEYDRQQLRLRYPGAPVTPPVPIPPTPTPTPVPTPGGGSMLRGFLLKLIRSAVVSYQEHAKSTPEPYDDVVASVLLMLLDKFAEGTLGKIETAQALREAANKIEV